MRINPLSETWRLMNIFRRENIQFYQLYKCFHMNNFFKAVAVKD